MIFDDTRKAAERFGTISYEMRTTLSPEVERILVQSCVYLI